MTEPTPAFVARLTGCLAAIIVAIGTLPAATAAGNKIREPGLPEIPIEMPTVSQLGDATRFIDLFSPFRTETAALSPDGKLLAYSVREKDELFLFIVPVDTPEILKSRIRILTDQLATPMMQVRSAERTPARIRWMKWITSTRLVFETNRNFAYGTGNSWSNATGEIVAIDADGGNPKTLASPRLISQPIEATLEEEPPEEEGEAAEDPFAALAGGAQGAGDSVGTGNPASIRIIGLNPADPQSILVRTQGRTFKVYEIDAVTGTRRLRSLEVGAPSSVALLDQLGRPRITISSSFRAAFPRPFVVESTKVSRRRGALGELTSVPGFSLAPETYFGERSVPLGFDEDPNILYFASNVGRDTYGVYSLNLQTGQRTAAAIESPVFDLYKPESGTFADASAFGLGIAGPLTDASAPAETDPFEAAVAAMDRDAASDADPNRHGSPALVFDRFQHKLAGIRFEGTTRSAIWVRPELQAVQAWLNNNLRGRTAEIIEWDTAFQRVLILTRGTSDPGAFHILDRGQQKFSEFVRRAPALDTGAMSAVVPFGFTQADGTRIDGTLALPRQARVTPIPLVVLCPALPWERRGAEYSREFDALARTGTAVVQINGRGIWGSGIRQRAAIKSGYDEAQVADIMAAIEHLAPQFKVSKKRVALIGRGHGGFIALRALQLHPDSFMGAVAIDAPVDLGTWLEIARRDQASFGATLTREMMGDEARLAAAPLVKEPERITAPIFLLAYRGEDDAQRRVFSGNRRLHAVVSRQAPASEFFEREIDHVAELPKAAAEEWRRIEAFLNTALYEYKVKVGETEVVPDGEQPARKE